MPCGIPKQPVDDVEFFLYHAVGHSKVPKERLQKEFFLKCKGDKSTDLLQTGKVKPSSRQDKDLKLFGQKPTLPLNYISYGIVLGCKSGRTATEARTCY